MTAARKTIVAVHMSVDVLNVMDELSEIDMLHENGRAEFVI